MDRVNVTPHEGVYLRRIEIDRIKGIEMNWGPSSCIGDRKGRINYFGTLNSNAPTLVDEFRWF